MLRIVLQVFNAGQVDDCYKCYSSVASAILSRRSGWKNTTFYRMLADAVAQSATEDEGNTRWVTCPHYEQRA